MKMNEGKRRDDSLTNVLGHEEEPFAPLTKTRLSDEARRQLLERIADGRMAASEPLTELELARRFGVSRTPLHEAMVSLGRDGLVESLGRRGWRVMPLSSSDAAEIYPVIASLEALALRLAGALVLGSVDELERLAEAARGASDVSARLSAEREWHEAMLAQCSNETLRQTVRPLRVRVARYDRAVAEWVPRPPSELGAIMECLRRADALSASKLLERHWLERGRSVATWMLRPYAAPPGREAPVPGAA